MNAFWQWLIHTLAGVAGVSISFDFIPHPYGVWVGAIWAGLVATAAFLNQSIGQTTIINTPPQKS